VVEGSSQCDKCQVGNMHPESLDLVHFSDHSIKEGIRESMGLL
jgi:hypothetical protein